ncbi:MAG: helix-turn-helix transcriptional regulator [Synergistes jonesii]|uniref:helix-turn-helix transcriptional regulator n=1 Tax=Synergistes jonesii TaxID=2754 RepID=UPI002A75D5A5|nr:helix-turn-helix transcriptional regulator [Synergistes jonesii]MDY2985922.1 helix-turn-helix transcriptional regulator [Synergistes jonesii]
MVRLNLHNARKSFGKTQREMSKLLGISEVYYRKIEAGARTGKYELWVKLATLLDTPQDILREDVKSVTEGEAKTK